MADQTVIPDGHQIIAGFDGPTNEQLASLILLAQKVFGSWSQGILGERAAASGGVVRGRVRARDADKTSTLFA
jgi:hypothetical protein